MTFFDFATIGQLAFQNPATPIAEGIIDLHHNIFFFLLLILAQVFWIFYIIFLRGSHFWQYPEFTHLHYFRKNYLVLNNQIHGTFLEIVWTITPSIILMMIAIPSFALLYSIDEVIDPQITIKVIGHQWYWSYEYSNKLEFDSYMLYLSDLKKGDLRLLEVDQALVCPIETHLRFIITSVDVLHSLAVPSLGIKVDAVPGRLNQVSVFIKRIGTFYGQCSELCGVNHGFMPIKVVSLASTNYDEWYKTKIPTFPVATAEVEIPTFPVATAEVERPTRPNFNELGPSPMGNLWLGVSKEEIVRIGNLWLGLSKEEIERILASKSFGELGPFPMGNLWLGLPKEEIERILASKFFIELGPYPNLKVGLTKEEIDRIGNLWLGFTKEEIDRILASKFFGELEPNRKVGLTKEEIERLSNLWLGLSKEEIERIVASKHSEEVK